MEEKTLETIKKTTGELLEKLQMPAEVRVEVDETETVHININSEETGILIGYHGETLSAFQLILGLMIYKKQASWIKIVVNVGDYRERRQEVLFQMAQNAVDRVKSTGESVILPYLNSGERRIIHIYLQENTEVLTESEGEGENRRLVIKSKAEKSETS